MSPTTTFRDRATHELELSREALTRLIDDAVARVLDHLDTLDEQPAADIAGGTELARATVEPLPETGSDHSELLRKVFEDLVPTSFNAAGPGYLAYIPGGGLPHSAVADLVAGVVNRYVGVWQAAPGLAQLEANVVRWFCDLIGYPAEALGFLTTGGSLANLSAVVTARFEKLGEDFADGVVYTGDQIHHSVLKATRLAGIARRRVRSIPSDEQYAIRVDELERRMEEDRRSGLAAFLIVASAGTTNTGAVDDLPALAELARRWGAWLHVDAAYGGFFALTERGRRTLRGLEKADSVTLDPHKGLFLPYGNGCLLVRDGDALRRTHSADAHYMPSLQDAPDLIDFCQISPELSRDFRGLRVWLPLKMHGAGAFREALDEKLDLALWASDRLREMPGIEIIAEPQLSIVAFRLALPEASRAERDATNRELLERINSRKRVYLTGTVLPAGFVLRICVLSFRTHMDRMEACIEDLRAAVAELGHG